MKNKKAKALSAPAKITIRLLYHKKEIESEQGESYFKGFEKP